MKIMNPEHLNPEQTLEAIRSNISLKKICEPLCTATTVVFNEVHRNADDHLLIASRRLICDAMKTYNSLIADHYKQKVYLVIGEMLRVCTIHQNVKLILD